MKNKDLLIYVTEGTKTIELMDKFEGFYTFDGVPYKRIVFKNIYECNLEKLICRFHLVIERILPESKKEGNITFSEFKKTKGFPVLQYANKMIREEFKRNRDFINQKKFYFNTPYYLRAQNSTNRQGYGWEWDWSDGYGTFEEGTYYGETSDYGFVCIIIEDIVLAKNYTKPISQKINIDDNIKIELV